MNIDDLKTRKKVSAFIEKPFNKRIKMNVEEQENAVTGAPVYKLKGSCHGLTLELWIDNQAGIDQWKIQ